MQTTTCKRAACGLAVPPYQRAKSMNLPSNATAVRISVGARRRLLVLSSGQASQYWKGSSTIQTTPFCTQFRNDLNKALANFEVIRSTFKSIASHAAQTNSRATVAYLVGSWISRAGISKSGFRWISYGVSRDFQWNGMGFRSSTMAVSWEIPGNPTQGR